MTTNQDDIPLEQWPLGWLELEVAIKLRVPEYIIMGDAERRSAHYPVTIEEMRDLVRRMRT